jgi:GTP cyclohydrolase II
MNNTNLTTKVERAISELRRGGKVVISDTNSGMYVLLMAAELIEDETIKEISQYTFSRPNIVLSGNRASTLGLNNNNHPCSILIENQWSKDDIFSLCMPLFGHKRPLLNGVIIEKNKAVIDACLLLLRQARLLPAALISIISNVNPENINQWTYKHQFPQLDVIYIQSFESINSETLKMSVKAKVPLAYTDECEIIVFRPKDGGNEHFCLVFGKTINFIENLNPNHIPLVRIHSQCITGDVLSSLKCDCGEQLRKSIKLMSEANEGLLIYLAQEGRDIGLLNKLRAYSLQEKGMDTVEANIALGFDDDERLYYPAKEILKKLKINALKLITNNPKKVEHLSNLGLKINKRIPIKINANKYNKKYLQTKSKKSGHIL